MKRIINKIFFVVTCMLLSTTSCNFLDVVPDDIPTIDYAFRNRTEAERYLFTCYSGRPDIGGVDTDPAMNGCDETWQRYITIDDGYWYTFENSKLARGEQNSNSPLFDWWDGYWQMIRICNTFLENIDGVHDLTNYERKRWVAEAKFLKAYYHYTLFKMYGPIPIMDVNMPVSSSVEEVQVYREPVDEVVTYISGLFLEAANDLPIASGILEGNEAGRVDQLAALTMRAELLLFAASPLFNGNTDYAALIDNRGVQLFPQEYKEEKWHIAAEACKLAIETCHDQGKDLYDLVDPLVENQHEILKLQTTWRQAICDKWNKELIWGSTKFDCNKMSRKAMAKVVRLGPVQLRDATAEWSPTLKMVEKFYSSNGVPIDEDTQWRDDDWYSDRYKIRPTTSVGDEKYYVKSGERTIYLHYNREPRFYASLGFDKGIYYGCGYYDFDSNVKYTDFLNLQISGLVLGDGYSISGYSVKKMHHFKNAQQYDAVHVEYFPFPILRLSNLYLMYAEALNEAEGPVSDVFYYLDKVRARAGLEGVKKSWLEHSRRPDKPDTKEGLRDIIRQERTVELAFEGKRFWDVRRWKQISVFNESLYGWNIRGETPEEFYNLTQLPRETLNFTVKDYFWPIRDGHLYVNKNLVQNYGW
jgi:hypothetical protein